jgi:hypothetical protein
MTISLKALFLTCVATTALAQGPNQLAIMSCQNAAVKEVRTQRPEADSVRFTPNPLVTARPRPEVGVQGAGHYLDKGRRQWRSFTYDCVYRTGSAKTRITVRIGDSSDTG